MVDQCTHVYSETVELHPVVSEHATVHTLISVSVTTVSVTTIASHHFYAVK